MLQGIVTGKIDVHINAWTRCHGEREVSWSGLERSGMLKYFMTGNCNVLCCSAEYGSGNGQCLYVSM